MRIRKALETALFLCIKKTLRTVPIRTFGRIGTERQKTVRIPPDTADRIGLIDSIFVKLLRGLAISVLAPERKS